MFDDKIKAIQKVEEIGAAYGIGRDMHVGDTIIGIKGRVGFEAAAPYADYRCTQIPRKIYIKQMAAVLEGSGSQLVWHVPSRKASIWNL